MNLFRYLCKGCGALYQELLENGVSKLVHRGLSSSDDPAPLPTSQCIPYHDYVLFEPCGHCCPEVFVSCRACKLGYPHPSNAGFGRPTTTDCYCHYCVEDKSLPRLDNVEGDYLLQEKVATGEFDVFLCHNSKDKSEVKRIALELKGRGIRPWLDEWEIRPGLRWRKVLEKQLNSIKSAAVFVGPSGDAPWFSAEIDVLLEKFFTKGSPVIPVILSATKNIPELSSFLRTATWVDFRKTDPDPMDYLEWGITGIRREGT